MFGLSGGLLGRAVDTIAAHKIGGRAVAVIGVVVIINSGSTGTVCSEDMSARPARHETDVDGLVLRDHLVVQIPASALAQLSHDDVAISYEVDVKIVVLNGLARDVNLRDVRVQKGDQLANGGDLERGADDDHQVCHLAVHINQAAREFVGQRLTEEGDVWFHDAALAGHVVL